MNKFLITLCQRRSACGSREAMLKGGRRGPAIVIGKPEESLLIKAVAHTHETLRMPKGAPRLSDQEISNLSQWIKDDAYWPAAAAAKNDYLIKPKQKTFWSFQPVRNPGVPTVKGKTGNAPTTVDAFLLAKLEANNLTFNVPADKRTLIRRATYDLTGLPPTPEEIDAFLPDHSSDAFAKVIDRLLASPHYGERWGRHWLDVARYSDTVGMIDAGRNTQGWFPYSNTYRDWVIRVEIHMSDCPLAQLAKNLKLLKKFDESGMVAIPLADWIRFFEALAFMSRDGQRESYCAIVEGYLVFSKTPFKKKPAPRHQDLFNEETHLCHNSKTQ